MSRPKPAEVASQTETSETCRGEGCLGLFSGAGAGSRERRKTAKDATGLPGSHALRRTRRWCVCTLHRQTAGPLVALQSPHSRRAMRAKTGRCRQKRKRHGRAEGNTSVERRKRQTRRGTPARPTSKRSGQDHRWLSMEIKTTALTQNHQSRAEGVHSMVGTGMEGTKRRAVTLLDPL